MGRQHVTADEAIWLIDQLVLRSEVIKIDGRMALLVPDDMVDRLLVLAGAAQGPEEDG